MPSFRRLPSLAAALGGALLMAACAGGPARVTGLQTRDAVRDFTMEARFALRLQRPHEAPASAAGRLSWEHTAGSDRMLIANPLGQGIARVETSASGAELRTADGQTRSASHAAALVEEATGYPLPIDDLPAWLLGRAGPAGRLERDAAGRPLRLAEAGWQIDYEYEDAAPGALPSRLTLRRSEEIELRLRVEEWREAP